MSADTNGPATDRLSDDEAIRFYLGFMAKNADPGFDMGHWSDFVNRVLRVLDRLRALTPPVNGWRPIGPLLEECVEKLDRYCNKQGPRRMIGDGEGSKANPNEGSHYPAVQSLIGRLKNAMREPSPDLTPPVGAEGKEDECAYCHGKGYVRYGDGNTPCSNCGGTGTIPKSTLSPTPASGEISQAAREAADWIVDLTEDVASGDVPLIEYIAKKVQGWLDSAAEPLRREMDELRANLKSWGVVELAVQTGNASLKEYMGHWENRAMDAEVQLHDCRERCAELEKGRDEARKLLDLMNVDVPKLKEELALSKNREFEWAESSANYAEKADTLQTALESKTVEAMELRSAAAWAVNTLERTDPFPESRVGRALAALENTRARTDYSLWLPVLRTEWEQAKKDREGLEQWKKEALIVASWWGKVDDAVRRHPQIRLGEIVPDVALRIISEHAALAASKGTSAP